MRVLVDKGALRGWWYMCAVVGEGLQMCGGSFGEKGQKQEKMGAKMRCDGGKFVEREEGVG